MAESKVPKGPGQAEVTGELKNPRDANPLGTYRDPESGKELEVTMHAGADALARMGWRHVRELGVEAPPEVPPEEPEEEETHNEPLPPSPVDDADEVEQGQDNAAGHKAEAVDEAPGVPAGDPATVKGSKADSETKATKASAKASK